MPVANGFVGRERELALLRTHLDRALGGDGGLVVLTGEPGIGKTRTADELARLARLQRAKVLWGRCYEGEGAPALWPWAQLLRTYARERDPAALRGELGSAAGVVAELVPDLGAKLPGLAAARRLEPPNARQRLFDGTAAFLQRAAGTQPLVLILDDLDWADQPSLLLLGFLAAELGDARLLVVASYRDTHPGGSPHGPALDQLAALPASERLQLAGLSPDEVGELIALSLGAGATGALLRIIHDQTGGNPFFVRELVRVLLAEGRLERVAAEETPLHAVAVGVRDVIVRRVARLSAFCQTLLESAAVLGREFRLPALAGMSGLPGDRLLDALQEAADAGLVAADRHVPGAWRFVHALIAETLYAELGPAVRVRLHQRAGEVLEQLAEAAGSAEPPVAELAHHFGQAARGSATDQAISYTVRAAERARGQLAFETAADRYRVALEALDLREQPDQARRRGFLLRLGESQRWAGDAAGARRSYLLAAELARQQGDAAGLARSALGFAGPAPVAAVSVEQATVNLLEEALDALGGDGAMRALTLGRLATELTPEPRAAARRASLSGEAVTIARRLDDTAVLGSALAARRQAVWGPDNLEERRELAAEIVAVADGRDDPELAMSGRRWLIDDLAELGETVAAERQIDVYARQTEELRQPVYRWVSAVHRTNRALLAGRFADAGTEAAIALAHGRRAVGDPAETEHAAAMFTLRREQGRLEDAEAAITAIVETSNGDPALGMLRCWLLAVRAELGREPEARAALELMAGDGFAALPRDAFWLGAVAALAEACALLGDAKRAAELYQLARPYADHNVVPGSLPCAGSVERCLGLLAATDGRFEEAGRHFDRATARNAELGARPLVAWSQHDHAAMLRARGRLDDAERVLALAADAGRTARELGMTRLEQRVSALRSLKGIGRSTVAGGGRSPGQPGPDGLTRREVEVLRLLATGRSNRAIADELVVTVNTVERHLVNLYRKIGATDRAAATRYARRRNLASAGAEDAPELDGEPEAPAAGG